MTRRTITACIMAITSMGYPLLAHGSERRPYSHWFRVQAVEDSIWWHCELDILVNDDDGGTLTRTCRPGDAAPKPVTIKPETLDPKDIEALRQLLRDADLFEGQFWGEDLRGLDMGVLILTVNDGPRIASVVAERNPSFDSGPRQRLVAWLTPRLKEARDRASSPK
jgi:hypothetical protein